ncbi:MAG: 6-carboxytetrahydropterin synthase QueD [Geoalkalibacter sp.]|jgi:6-pyruvoyltetrahydropterin/6-carboxytetrahydropterin synthase|uniref:6-carboxytetrahydropterin synthase QueD n=1 Tax=Geoalkalibacter sp. TaxID=3041440 RepID=UPI002AA071BC|nr:6-carboxytetrahydropterin synthase QueD [Thermodesulfobacteriota bacterium]
MFLLKIQSHFAAAHNLIHYQGDCENLHGHNWKVEVEVGAHELDKAGLAVDFKVLKRETNRVLDLLDHKYLNEVKPFDELSPSSENIACFVFEQLCESLNDGNVFVKRVTVWESDNACASYVAD